jgi:hypothetical protein
MKGGRILRIKTDTWRRIRWDLALGAIVGVWSWWWRNRLDRTRPGFVYFSDSWDYVNVAHDRTQPPDPFHSPFIETLWRYGTNHHFNEVAVAHLQQMAGVVICVAMYVALRGVAVRWVAFPFAILLSFSPLELFSERAFLTECGTTLFVVLGLAAAARMLKPAPLKHSPWWLFGAAISWGTAAAIRPALQLFAVAAIGYLSLQYAWRYRRNWKRWQTYRQLILVAPLTLVLTAWPMWSLQDRYHHYYGTSSPTPAQGVVLLTRWGHLVPCAVADNHKGLVRKAILQVCEKPYGEVPGVSTNALWRPGAISDILEDPVTLRRNSKTLARITQAEIRKHPGEVLSEIKRSIVWQLTKPPVEPASLYHNGSGWFSKVIKKHFAGHAKWFQGASTRAVAPVAFLADVEKTIQLPQILLWSAVGLAALRSLVWLIWRRGKWALNHMVVISVLLIGTGVVSVALGSVPGFRYWIPLQPGVMLLLAAALWPRRRLTYDEVVPADLPDIQ